MNVLFYDRIIAEVNWVVFFVVESLPNCPRETVSWSFVWLNYTFFGWVIIFKCICNRNCVSVLFYRNSVIVLHDIIVVLIFRFQNIFLRKMCNTIYLRRHYTFNEYSISNVMMHKICSYLVWEHIFVINKCLR